VVTAEPISILVRRSKCPHCGRTHSRPARTREHMGRCWKNPEARGCLTCTHFQPAEGDSPDPTIGYPGHFEPESCAVGVNLAGHPACPACSGYGWKDTSSGAEVPCTAEVTVGHIGDGKEIKPGPIVHCPKWEPKTEEDE